MEGYDGPIQIIPEKTDITKEYMIEVIPKMIEDVKINIASDGPDYPDYEPKTPKTLKRLNNLILNMEQLLEAVQNFPYTKRTWRSIEIHFNNYNCIFYG